MWTIFGQDHLLNRIEPSLLQRRQSHAYLLSGPPHVGKMALAVNLAQAVNCLEGPSVPCGLCNQCTRIAQGHHASIFVLFPGQEIDGERSPKTVIGINAIREATRRVSLNPYEGSFNVVIIDGAEAMSEDASNAFLKTLEEPPSYVIFVLATTDPYKMPATILSRTQRYDFRRLSIEDIKKQLIIILNVEEKKYDDNGLNLIARKADGSMRDALGYLDQIINYCDKEITLDNIRNSLGMVSDEIYLNLFDGIYNAKISVTVELLNKTMSEGVSVQEFISGYNSFLRTLLHKLLKIDNSDDDFVIQWLSENPTITQLDIVRTMEFIIQFELKMKFLEHPDLALELLLVKLCNLDKLRRNL